MIPAMGFDYVPGDMIASLTAEGMGELDEVTLHYCWQGFVPSQGTARTTLEMISDPGVEWRDGIWQGARGRRQPRDLRVPGPRGPPGNDPLPGWRADHGAAPHPHPQRPHDINASAFASEKLAPLFAADDAAGRACDEDAAEAGRSGAVSRLPEGPTAEQREQMLSTIVCLAKRGEFQRMGVVTCRDVYGLTAAAIRQGAMIAAAPDFQGRGGLAPSQAFDPKDFLAGLDRFDVRWNRRGRRLAAPGRGLSPMAIGLGARRRRAVSLERAAGPETPRCPACGEPLFVWIETDGYGIREDQVIDRCENCGLVVARGADPHAGGGRRTTPLRTPSAATMGWPSERRTPRACRPGSAPRTGPR